MKFKIVFEDSEILVVDKPSGLVVNRAETVKGPSLQDEILDYLSKALPEGTDPNIGERAGIVHRLDRETSGLLVVAKTQKAFEYLQKQFEERKVSKKYIALVHGRVSQKEGIIEGNIARIGKFGKFGVVDSSIRNRYNTGWGKDGRRSLVNTEQGKPSYAKASTGAEALADRSEGKESRTDYEVESRYVLGSDPNNKNFGKQFLKGRTLELSKNRINYLKHHAIEYTLLNVFPKTGRTHQIRVHLKSIGHPVVSDQIYAPGKLLKFDLMWCLRLFLHAKSLEFVHPVSNKAVKFISDLPKELKNAMLFLSTND